VDSLSELKELYFYLLTSSISTWHCIVSVELTKTHSFPLFFLRFCPLGIHIEHSEHFQEKEET